MKKSSHLKMKPRDRDLHRLFVQHCTLTEESGLALTVVQGYPLASLFAYRGPIRQHILDFKIKGIWQSGVSLANIFANHPAVQDYVKEADFLMPAPSSFWGRWRGKHDLAYALAEALGSEKNIPLQRAPWIKHFRFKKQSFLSRSQRRKGHALRLEELSPYHHLQDTFDSLKLAKVPSSDSPLIVIIDDIVTSSNTLTVLAGAFKNIRFRFLTLASAYHKTNDTICWVREDI